MRTQKNKFSICYFLILLIFGCESNEKIEISCVQENKQVEITIQNKSNHSIFLSEVIECDQQNDSVIIQPKIIRPGDWLYNRIESYAFVPPKFKRIVSGKNLTFKLQDGDLTKSHVFFRVYDSDFDWKPSKQYPSHEEAYFKFEEEHSTLQPVKCK
ncbi:MAG: hypothetical protein MJK07_16355 [Flavobacteriales bacterium]|nr:hypothetical protein [Flavobacteriales bacterium]